VYRDTAGRDWIGLTDHRRVYRDTAGRDCLDVDFGGFGTGDPSPVLDVDFGGFGTGDPSPVLDVELGASELDVCADAGSV